MIPRLEIAAFDGGSSGALLIHVGPHDLWDFQDLVSEVLSSAQLVGRAASARSRPHVVCSAVFDEETPAFGLSRVQIGQLVGIGASIELVLTRATVGGGGKFSDAGSADIPRLNVEFSLQTHDGVDPSVISQRLGIDPVRAIRSGATEPVTGRISPTTRWKVATGERAVIGFDSLVDEMLGLLYPRRSAVASLIRDSVDGVFSLVGHFSSGPPMLQLTSAQLKRIRDLGAEIDVDIGLTSGLARSAARHLRT